MADHLIERRLAYVVVRCGNLSCQETWQQLALPGDGERDWHVCPHCNWSAPTNVARALRDSQRATEEPS